MSDHDEGRPPKGPAHKPDPTRSSSSPEVYTDDAARHVVKARRQWAYALISRASAPPPLYGSADWLALPEGSAERVAAVVIAAEAWALGGDTLAEDLAHEIDGRRRSEKQAEDVEYVARHQTHRRRWRHLALVPARYAGQEVRDLKELGASTRQGGSR